MLFPKLPIFQVDIFTPMSLKVTYPFRIFLKKSKQSKIFCLIFITQFVDLTQCRVSNSPPEFGGEFGLWKIRLIFDFWTCVRRSSSTTFVSGRRWPSWWCCLRGGPWGGRARFVKFSCCSRTRVVLAPGALSCYRVSRSGPVVTQWDPRHNNKTTILREDSKNFLLWIW